MNNNQLSEQKKGKKGFSGLQVAGIALLVMALTVMMTLVVARAYLFPKPFEPVVLTSKEQQQLEELIEAAKPERRSTDWMTQQLHTRARGLPV